jgi:hypothetical protein
MRIEDLRGDPPYYLSTLKKGEKGLFHWVFLQITLAENLHLTFSTEYADRK